MNQLIWTFDYHKKVSFNYFNSKCRPLVLSELFLKIHTLTLYLLKDSVVFLVFDVTESDLFVLKDWKNVKKVKTNDHFIAYNNQYIMVFDLNGKIVFMNELEIGEPLFIDYLRQLLIIDYLCS